MRKLLIVALGLLVSGSLAAQTCEEKESEAVFSVLPACGAGCSSVSAICTASGIPQPDCSLCISGLLADGRALECASGMYCWQEHSSFLEPWSDPGDSPAAASRASLCDLKIPANR